MSVVKRPGPSFEQTGIVQMKGPTLFQGEIITKKRKYCDEIKKFLLQNHLCYMAEILLIWRKTVSNQSVSKTIGSLKMMGPTFFQGEIIKK